MTSIHTYDPSDGPALPELPPLPIGVLAVGTADLLQQAADLPQPVSIHPQSVTCSSPSRPASAITRWALRFGSVVTSSRQGEDGPRPGTASSATRHGRHGLRPHPGRTASI